MLVRATLRVFVSASWGEDIASVERLLDEIEDLKWWNVGARDGGPSGDPMTTLARADVLLIPGSLSPAAAAAAEVETRQAAKYGVPVIAVVPFDERHRAEEIIEQWRDAGVPTAPWSAAAVEGLLNFGQRGGPGGRLAGPAVEGLEQAS